jgi:hypothetical protein
MSEEQQKALEQENIMLWQIINYELGPPIRALHNIMLLKRMDLADKGSEIEAMLEETIDKLYALHKAVIEKRNEQEDFFG